MKRHTRKTKLQKHAEKIRMSAFERGDLRDRIVSYMEYHPRREKIQQPAHSTGLFRRITAHAVVWRAPARSVMGVVMLLIIVGVPFAAERSVPGDVLYPVKVRFNEEVREQFSSSEYQKIAWETERVERRIAEARLLAREGKLTEETETALGEDIVLHTQAARAALEELRKNNADDAAVAEVAFTSALDVQSHVLDSAIAAEKQRSSSTRASVEDLAHTVREVLSSITHTASSTPPSFTGFMAHVEAETTRARELFQSVGDAASEVERTEILGRLKDAEQAIQDAQNEREAGDEQQAIATLRTALSNTQKLIAFMTDIDLRTHVSLETLVPRTLSVEERIATVASSTAEIRVMEETIRDRLPRVESEDITKRVQTGLEDLTELLAQTDIPVEKTDGELKAALRDAEDALFEAHVLARELETLTAFVTEEMDGGEAATTTPSIVDGTSTPAIGTTTPPAASTSSNPDATRATDTPDEQE